MTAVQIQHEPTQHPAHEPNSEEPRQRAQRPGNSASLFDSVNPLSNLILESISELSPESEKFDRT
ncbi:hypothetical protein PanWU01x14_369940 [Parasponia andersonii]|uniref:Uncharacterized protein n=1 Tax=Parasponia andersonii TaxID=3476 RepID=A0A2P5A4F6_PARAD|nr:hypothetical protein PanWU01x14_369940 [Parasponia andersonii]